MQRITLRLGIIMLLVVVSGGASAQDDAWTCDDGPNDVLNAAQAAYDEGDLEQAYELAQLAERVCGSGSTVNLIRYNEALRLRMELEREGLSTLTPAPVDRREESIELNSLGLQAYSQGRYEEALVYYALCGYFYRGYSARHS